MTSRPLDSLAGALALIRHRRLSCPELLDLCLDLIRIHEPQVHAWVQLDPDGARTQALELQQRLDAGLPVPPLLGTPLAVKDIIDVAGLPTACGASRWASGPAAADAPIVARLRQAGAIVLGKSVTTPYAWVDPPPTRNPLDLDHTPGGSSSGSAAALAARMALAALGTQTGGSILRPASYCGVCGLKPSHGALPLNGILPLAPSLDHAGLLARTVADLELLWNALAPNPELPNPGPRRPLVLGRLRGPFDDKAAPTTRAAVDALCSRLESADIAQIRETPLPPAFDSLAPSFRTILAAEAAHFHAARFARDPADYPPQMTTLIQQGLAVDPTALAEARAHHARLRRDVDHAWQADNAPDAWLMPTTPAPAPDRSTTGDPAFQSPWSYAGLPALTLPIPGPATLPLGLQLVAPRHAEARLLQIARTIEAALYDREDDLEGRSTNAPH